MTRYYIFLITLFAVILSSCHTGSGNQILTSNQFEICDSKLSAYKSKYDFIHSLDSLRKIQPCVSELMGDNYEEVINRSLFDFIRNNYLGKLDESQYDLFYKHPGTSVALYNYIFETEEVEEIENGIETK